MPTSTSSNTRLGVSEVCAVITCIARLIRDSSPPEATLISGLGGCPGLVLTRNSIDSSPCWEGCSDSDSTNVTLSSAWGMPRFFSWALTALSSFFAALRRCLETSLASLRNCSRSKPSLALSCSNSVSEFSNRASCSLRSAISASSCLTGTLCLRARSCRAPRRALTVPSRCGSA